MTPEQKATVEALRRATEWSQDRGDVRALLAILDAEVARVATLEAALAKAREEGVRAGIEAAANAAGDILDCEKEGRFRSGDAAMVEDAIRALLDDVRPLPAGEIQMRAPFAVVDFLSRLLDGDAAENVEALIKAARQEAAGFERCASAVGPSLGAYRAAAAEKAARLRRLAG